MIVTYGLTIAWSLFHVYSASTLTVHRYREMSTSLDNTVTVRHFNTSLIACAIQHSMSCQIHGLHVLATGQSQSVRKCVGFQFYNGSCILYSLEEQETQHGNIKIKIYLTILDKPPTEQGTSASVSNIRDESKSLASENARNNKIQTTPLTSFTGTRMFGGRCSESRQCGYRHGFCLDGKCACDIGYSYDFNSKICVTRCIHYGSQYSAFPKSGVNGCNIKTFSFFDAPTQESCVQQCLEEKEFVCINAEYKFTRCCLCDKAWVDLDEPLNGTNEAYTLFYRHCA